MSDLALNVAERVFIRPWWAHGTDGVGGRWYRNEALARGYLGEVTAYVPEAEAAKLRERLAKLERAGSALAAFALDFATDPEIHAAAVAWFDASTSPGGPNGEAKAPGPGPEAGELARLRQLGDAMASAIEDAPLPAHCPRVEAIDDAAEAWRKARQG